MRDQPPSSDRAASSVVELTKVFAAMRPTEVRIAVKFSDDHLGVIAFATGGMSSPRAGKAAASTIVVKDTARNHPDFRLSIRTEENTSELKLHN